MPKVDLSEFAAQKRQRGPRCGIARMELTGEQKAKFEAALKSPEISTRVITDVLKSWGYEVGDQVTFRHRAGRCSCGK